VTENVASAPRERRNTGSEAARTRPSSVPGGENRGSPWGQARRGRVNQGVQLAIPGRDCDDGYYIPNLY
jgi:hypothetical protein